MHHVTRWGEGDLHQGQTSPSGRPQGPRRRDQGSSRSLVRVDGDIRWETVGGNRVGEERRKEHFDFF
jgi:hypothetical protein